MDYAVNRTYDSKQGRFTQVDPIGMGAVSFMAPQTLNMYTYCGNDPINYTDPSGLFWGFLKKLFKWVLVAIAVVVAILTIVAAPITIAGILGIISAASGAAASVLGALGYNRAAMIFGLIAVATGFGSLIAGHIATNAAAASAAARTPGSITLAKAANFASEAAKTYKDAALFGILSGVGAIANNLSRKTEQRNTQSTGNGVRNIASAVSLVNKLQDDRNQKIADCYKEFKKKAIGILVDSVVDVGAIVGGVIVTAVTFITILVGAGLGVLASGRAAYRIYEANRELNECLAKAGRKV